MAIRIDSTLTAQKLTPKLTRLFELSAGKILNLERDWNSERGAPVFTVRGKYTSRNWTEWTQGFQFGSALLQFDATGEKRFLEIGRRGTLERMARHVSHVGVHDHGFNNISTYGNLRRLMREGKIPHQERELGLYELALKVSGAVQASRWTQLEGNSGYIYSFNGPHSLFIDTMRSLRSLAVAHQLGHILMGEGDRQISLLERLVEHAAATARFNIYYGQGRDSFDTQRGRTAQESIFNVKDGQFRCPATQQGYSPFSTWTRGLAWGLLGYAEQLEFLSSGVKVKPQESEGAGARRNPPGRALESGKRSQGPPPGCLLQAAEAAADYFIKNSCADGVPMWDTAAPGLQRLGSYLDREADPFNSWEPVDSSAAAIAAQGLIRLGNSLRLRGEEKKGVRYRQAGLTITHTLFEEPYLSTDEKHQGLVLHSVYHRPNGWDNIAPGQKVPNGESSMWGDYHARELALLLWREARGERYPTFFDQAGRKEGRA